MIPVQGTARLHVPDWLPASINALRVLVWRFAAISLFWIASAWPSGATAITFCAVIVVLLPLQGDLAYSASMTFLKGCVLGAGVAAVLVFAILPRATSFPEPLPRVGPRACAVRISDRPAREPLFFSAASVNFVPMLSHHQRDDLRRIAVLEQLDRASSPASLLGRSRCSFCLRCRRRSGPEAARLDARRSQAACEAGPVAKAGGRLGKPRHRAPAGDARAGRAGRTRRARRGGRCRQGDRAPSPRRAAVRPGRGRGRGASSAGRRTKRRGESSASRTSTAMVAALPRPGPAAASCLASGPASWRFAVNSPECASYFDRPIR